MPPRVVIDEKKRTVDKAMRRRALSMRKEPELEALERERRANVLKEEKVKQEQAYFLSKLESEYGVLTYALRESNVSAYKYEQWMKDYPEFRAAVSKMTSHKKDFAEKKLLELVDKGEIAPTIFINRTLNSDRGYGELGNGKTGLAGNISLQAIKEEIGVEGLYAAFKAVLEDDEKVNKAISNLRSLRDLVPSVDTVPNIGKPQLLPTLEDTNNLNLEEIEETNE